MRRRTSSRDLVISANVGTARSITDTVCFLERVSGNFILCSLLESADMYSIDGLM
jgi:hypothetical protein